MCHAIVIEDEPFIALHMADLAEEAGATSVELVDSESEAIRAARLKKPDIIVSDVRLRAGTGQQRWWRSAPSLATSPSSS